MKLTFWGVSVGNIASYNITFQNEIVNIITASE